MPVEKTSGAGSRARKTANFMCTCESGGQSFGKKVILTLLGIFLAYSIVLLGTFIRNNLQKYRFIGKAASLERTITVEADGKVTAVPNLAVVTMGVILKGDTVAQVQQKSNDTVAALVARLKAIGIEKNDIQTTDYRIYPKVKYSPKQGETADGYEVSQNVTIKIRDLSRASQVLGLAGEVGANSVSGVQFTIDDLEVYKSKARDLALRKIADKVRRLSQALGVRVTGVVAFNEYEPLPGGPLYGPDGGLGGRMSDGAPINVEAGNNEVTLRVSVSYQIE